MLIAVDEQSYRTLGVQLHQSWPRQLHAQLLDRLAQAEVARVVFDVLFLDRGADPEIDQAFARGLSRLTTVIGVDTGVREVQGYRIADLLLPHETFRTPYTTLALVGLPEDFGVVRRFRPVGLPVQARNFPTLAEAAAGGLEQLPSTRDFINYYGPAGTIPTFTYAQVLDPEYPISIDALRGKTVFVGFQLRSELGPAQKDSFLTPFTERGRTFGVEIHATAAANIIGHDWISRSSERTEQTASAAIGFLFGSAFVLFRPAIATMLLLLAVGVWSSVGYLSFVGGLFIPGASSILIVGPGLFLLATGAHYVVTVRQKRQAQRAFEHYLSPTMARRVAEDPQALARGGKEVVCTAMFTDIAGFTAVSESMKAEDVAHMLNDYFTEVVDVIIDRQGTLIKYIGDAAFAIWGAPVPDPAHAQHALDTALDMRRRIREFNRLQRYPVLTTRIGLHTGPMVVGNLGSARRFDYTAIGDSVNLTARLEGVNKYLGTTLLFSDAVVAQGAHHPEMVRLGRIAVAGKSAGVTVYTIFDTPLPEGELRMWEQIQAALGSGECRTLPPLLDALPTDSPIRKTAELIRLQLREDSWDGVIRLQEK